MLQAIRKRSFIASVRVSTNYYQQVLWNSTIVANQPSTFSSRHDALRPEDALLAHTDPFGTISTKIHPAILRTFKESRSLKKSENKRFIAAMKSTEKALLTMNKKLSTSTSSMDIFRSSYVIGALKISSTHLKEIAFDKLSLDAECRGVASFLTITMPRSLMMWNDFDKNMADRIHQYPNVELGLLVSYALKSAKTSYPDMKLPMETPHALLGYLSKYKQKHTHENIFELLLSSVIEDENACISPIGVPTVRDNKSIELVGLLFDLFASNPRTVEKLSNKNRLLEDLSIFTQKSLSSILTPVKLHSLHALWETIPLLTTLPDSYVIYVALYKQILFSINTEPLQLVHQEDHVASLLDSMVQAKFKSSKLIDRLYEYVSLRGINYTQIHLGLKIFNALVQLDHTSFANMILTQIVNQKTLPKMEQVFAQVNGRRIVTFSDQAKKEMSSFFKSRIVGFEPTTFASISPNASPDTKITPTQMTKRKILEVTLALLAYNHENNKHYINVLESLETSLLQYIPSATYVDLIALLHAYALAGRLCLPIFESIDQYIPQSIGLFNIKQSAVLIWICARLNHRPEYLTPLIEQFFQKSNSTRCLSTGDAYVLSRTLWSLAVLQKLDLETFHHQQTKLFHVASTMFAGVNVQVWLFSQLSQIRNELVLQQRSKPNNKALTSLEYHCLSTLESFLQEFMIWKNSYKKQLLAQQEGTLGSGYGVGGLSSYTHLEASKLLSGELGISHENEKMLANGYIVDIFIPYTLPYTPNSTTLSQYEYEHDPSGLKEYNMKYKKKVSTNNDSNSNNSDNSGSSDSEVVEDEDDFIMIERSQTNDMKMIKQQQPPPSRLSSHTNHPHNHHHIKRLNRYNKHHPINNTTTNNTSSNSNGYVGGYNDHITGNQIGIRTGIVLEFDGPFHFETYLNQPLGPTFMKRRHIEALGYHLISVPYTQYRPDLFPSEKIKILKEIVDRGITALHTKYKPVPNSVNVSTSTSTSTTDSSNSNSNNSSQ